MNNYIKLETIMFDIKLQTVISNTKSRTDRYIWQFFVVVTFESKYLILKIIYEKLRFKWYI